VTPAERLGADRTSRGVDKPHFVWAEAAIHRDAWRGDDCLVDIGYSKNFSVSRIDKECANEQSNPQGVEGFGSLTKRHLLKIEGVSAASFYIRMDSREEKTNGGSISRERA
jgi:hypothetical protein